MFVEKVNDSELRFKNPGQLLLVVISFIFWGIGFLDLLGHTSAEPDIFGLYSLSFFLFIILYGFTGIIWILLFVNPTVLSRVTRAVSYIQSSSFRALTFFIVVVIALYVILEWDRWSRLPGLQFTAFGLVILSALIVLFANWKKNEVWRKLVAFPLLALCVLELILQAAAWTGMLPGSKSIGGNFYPYERIYYNGESPQNEFANRYGWYLPDEKLDETKRRILIVGGSYVSGLQVQPEEQFSKLLLDRINQGQQEGSGPVEIIAIGIPGFGLTPFISEDYVQELAQLLKFDEIIVIFHLGDDFQSPEPSDNPVRFNVSDPENVEVHSEDAQLRHDLTHFYLRGFLSMQLVETIRSNYLTPRVVSGILRGGGLYTQVAGVSTQPGDIQFPRLVGFVTDEYAMTEPGHAGIKDTEIKVRPTGNNFMFREDGTTDRVEALILAETILETTQQITKDNNIQLRVVTVPLFPDAFYKTYSADDWEPKLGEYDLFLPERALLQIANKYDIDILPMAETMLEDGLSVEEIQALYLPLSEGGFTPEGHKYLAEAIFTSFYNELE